ncbi:Ankyrin repeat-containing protein BDA1 [Vitis vinifera]|uniref:Ankyrin repeat-containing protein BDA1 n=1 Tax=Vitis vinifera TaxID=29760 RepID=A0A438GV18_VITVI|nr:Ankyrin repeat-containing protein BDA1 [Vitis vinifera]
MDPRLYSVARLGSLAALNSLLEEDPLLLEKVALSSSADTPLHIATLAANTDFAKEMLLRMPNFAWELNQDGFSPLHIAAAMGNIEITRELLSLDSGLCPWELLSHCYEAVKEVSGGGETALHLAVKNSQFEVLKVLVEKLGEDDRDRLINARDDQGHTVLKLAVAKGQVQAQNLLKNQSKQDKDVSEAHLEAHLDGHSKADVQAPIKAQFRRILDALFTRLGGMLQAPWRRTSGAISSNVKVCFGAPFAAAVKASFQ